MRTGLKLLTVASLLLWGATVAASPLYMSDWGLQSDRTTAFTQARAEMPDLTGTPTFSDPLGNAKFGGEGTVLSGGALGGIEQTGGDMLPVKGAIHGVLSGEHAVSPVPEPSSLLLLSSGLGVAAYMIRRKRGV